MNAPMMQDMSQTELQHSPKLNQKKPRISFARIQKYTVITLALLVFLYITLVMRANIGLALYIDGRYVGHVSDPRAVQLAMDRISVTDGVMGDMIPKIKTGYAFSIVDYAAAPLDKDDCYQILTNYLNDYYTEAYALNYSDTTLAYLSTYDQAKEVIDRLGISIAGSSDISLVDYTIEKTVCPKQEVRTADATFLMLSSSLSIPTVDDEVEGDKHQGGEENGEDGRIYAYLSDASYRYDEYYGVDVLRNESPGQTMTDELVTMLAQMESAYRTTYTEKTNELIPFQTVTVESDEYYVGTTIVEVEGQTGLEQITWQVTGLAGKEISRTKLATKIITQPQDARVIVGTKPYPQKIPTGTYIHPLQEYTYISSYFGWRSDPFTGQSSYHSGMDFAAKKGTPIYAIDGGEVIYAGWQGTYGLVVYIDHGNGLVSIYAHQNELLVKAGEHVHQGQQIGAVGNTGRSTGYHLHLEMQLNGVRKDPLKYIPKKP